MFQWAVIELEVAGYCQSEISAVMELLEEGQASLVAEGQKSMHVEELSELSSGRHQALKHTASAVVHCHRTVLLSSQCQYRHQVVEASSHDTVLVLVQKARQDYMRRQALVRQPQIVE